MKFIFFGCLTLFIFSSAYLSAAGEEDDADPVPAARTSLRESNTAQKEASENGKEKRTRRSSVLPKPAPDPDSEGNEDRSEKSKSAGKKNEDERKSSEESAKESAREPEKKKAPAKAKVRPIRFITWKGTRYVLLFDVADYYDFESKYTKEGVTLTEWKKRIEMYYDRREGSINGTKVFFLQPVLYRDRKPYITEADFLKVIDPALRSSLVRKQKIKTIMIDPGHGGSDAGAPGPVLAEKQINLLIGMKLKKALTALGYKVIMTRTSDTFPTLDQRSELCRKKKPDLYISIHCNSAASANVSGIETFLLTPAGHASTADKEASKTLYGANAYDPNSYRLAWEVQRALLKFTGSADRGVRHARFFVLRNASCPSILIETGFLSNRAEGKALSTNERQNRVVAAILSGLTRYVAATEPATKNKDDSGN